MTPIPLLWAHFFMLFSVSFPVMKLSMSMQRFFYFFVGPIPDHSPGAFAEDVGSLAAVCESLGTAALSPALCYFTFSLCWFNISLLSFNILKLCSQCPSGTRSSVLPLNICICKPALLHKTY